MPILKVKDPATGEWVQVGVSTEATGAQIAAHNTDPESHTDIREAIALLVQASANLAAVQEGSTQIVASTTDLEDGVSPLPDNTLYLVYE